ncbi:glycosyltransferase family 2 protein [Methylobacterium sp. A54F]
MTDSGTRAGGAGDGDTFLWPPGIVPVRLDERLRILGGAELGSLASNPWDVLFVAPAGVRICPDLLRLVQPYLDARPDVGIFYGDEASLGPDGVAFHCKPSFSPALLFAGGYVGFPLLIRASVLPKLESPPGAGAPEAAWFGLCLAALSAGVGIDRIPHTLIVHPGKPPTVGATQRAQVLAGWFGETGAPYRVRPGLTAESLELYRPLADPPPVTLVIPTRQSAPAAGEPPHIVRLLDSLASSTYPPGRIRVLVGDDLADDAAYAGRRDPFALARVHTPLPPGERFNYAAKMNRLWRLAETEHLILMNDDIVVRAPGWIEALLTFATDPEVGGVGARLLYPDGRIQHAGMFGGIYGVCAHPWYLQAADAPTYDDWALKQRDCSAVTGAVFATRRSVLEAANGFDEGFSLDFNDVDLCFRLRMLGYRIVYTPYAEMIHHEKASRHAHVAPGSQVARYLRRWDDVLTEDPMYSPQLRTDTDVVAPRGVVMGWMTDA